MQDPAFFSIILAEKLFQEKLWQKRLGPVSDEHPTDIKIPTLCQELTHKLSLNYIF